MLEEVDGMSKGLLEKNIIKRIQELIEKSEKPLDFQKSLVFLLQNFSKSKPILLYSEVRINIF